MNVPFTKIYLPVLLVFSLLSFRAQSQITISPTHTAAELASTIAGRGITVLSPTLTCPSAANGTFVVTSSPLGIDSGIVLTTGRASSVSGSESTLASTSNGAAGDADLGTLAGTTTHDACILEFNFIPVGDTVKFQYVFGSEEYINSTCGIYNDAFAFFISGPGIATPENMALVPGTTIPVTVNSVNNGIPGSGAGTDISHCTSMGPGSPFTSYYVDNTGGTVITYKGFTVPFDAVHEVTPCDTYHLKMTIADGGNYLYDSGVFIAAGSLKTRNYHFDSSALGAVIDGTEHSIRKGCAPAIVTINSSLAVPTDQTVRLALGGTGVNGYDYATLADSVILPAGDTSVSITVQGLATPPTGTKTLVLYVLSPYACGGIMDSVTLNLVDGSTLTLLTPDTTVCEGAPVHIRTVGSDGLVYSWTPGAGLDDSTSANPTAILTPGTYKYVVSAGIPVSGCASLEDSLTITVTRTAVTILTPDTSVCDGASVNIRVDGPDTLIYNWLPGTSLSSAAVQDPVATPAITTTYTLTATVPVLGCTATRTLTITVNNIDISMLTPDTTLCQGSSLPLRVSGDNTFAYNWSPADGLSDPTAKLPTATPPGPITYTVTASVPGTSCSVSKSVSVSTFSISVAAGNDTSICPGFSAMLSSVVTSPIPLTYAYTWAGPDGFSSTDENPTVTNVQSVNTGVYSVSVIGNSDSHCFAQSTMKVALLDTAAPPLVQPESLCLGAHADPLAAGGTHLLWYTSADDNDGVPAPPTPITDQVGTYYYYVTQTPNMCTSGKNAVEVTVANCCEGYVDIPTAFTPNGDGLNDKFRVKRTPNYLVEQFNIFNRWGQLIFEGNNSNSEWDGTVGGQPAPSGTYYYEATVDCINAGGQEMKYHGDVTLIR